MVIRILAIALLLSALSGSGVIWLKMRKEYSELQVQLAAARTAGDDFDAGDGTTSRPSNDDSYWTAKVAELTTQLQEESANLSALVAETEALDASIPIEADEIATSFGSVARLGREAGSILHAFANAVPQLKNEWSSSQESEASQFDFNRMMELFAWIPEVSGFESTPNEIASFQSEALGHLFELEETQVDQMRSIIHDKFGQMNDGQLTVDDRPEPGDAGDAWAARRTAALVALMHELRPFLPDSKPDTIRHILPAVLNLGIGVETNFERDGESATSTMNLPTWPKVPW